MTLSNQNVTTTVLEQACTFIAVNDSYSVDDGGDLHLRSPLVNFAAGFTVAAGGKLTVQSMTPDS